MRILQRRLVRLGVLNSAKHSPRRESVLQKLKSYALVFVFVIAALGQSISSAQAAVILNIDASGQLTGAQNVMVGTLGLFDVTFLDSNCIALFSGCDELADFDFPNSAADAGAAAQALLDQVFTDTAAGAFDSSPDLTFGCTGNEMPCQTEIPFAFIAGTTEISIFVSQNAALNTIFSDLTFSSQTDRTFDSSVAGAFAQNFASFTPVAVVPLPPAALLFVSALVGLAGFARRRRQA